MNISRKLKFILERIGVTSIAGGFIFLNIFLMVFSPVITFICAYVGGMFLNWIIGTQLVDGLNLIFNTTRFTRELLPLICATLATIGRYFTLSLSNKNNE